MSVIVYWELHMPVCDFCGTHLAASSSVEAARDAMKRAGWGTQSIPEDAVRASEQVLFASAEEPGAVAVDLCALCVRLGKRYEDKPPPIFLPGGYRRFGK